LTYGLVLLKKAKAKSQSLAGLEAKAPGGISSGSTAWAAPHNAAPAIAQSDPVPRHAKESSHHSHPARHNRQIDVDSIQQLDSDQLCAT